MTVGQQSKLMERIESLSELEFSSLIDEIFAHVARNKWQHLVDSASDLEDIRGQLEDTTEELTQSDKEIESLKEVIRDINDFTVNVMDVEEFEEGAFDKLKCAIREINELT